MSKFAYSLTAVFLIELALYIFVGTSYAQTTLFGLLLNPSTIISNGIYILILGVLGVFALSAILPGNFIQINIYALYAGMAVVIVTFILNIVHLSSFIYGVLVGINGMGTSALWITSLICGPLLIFYLISTMEWVRSNN